MINFKNAISAVLVLGLVFSCDRKDEDLVDPVSPEEFPAVIVLSDEGDGDLEDNDEVGIALEILPIWNNSDRDPDGKIVPPQSDLTVSFLVSDPEGFENLSEYILGGEVVYEIDDCTNSSDAGIDLMFIWNSETGEGTFTWPAGIAELEVLLEVDPVLFNDDVINEELRGFKFAITALDGPGVGSGIEINSDLEFEYLVLDEEGLFGAWEFDYANEEMFNAFKNLFGKLNEDLADLEVDQIDAIEIEYEYESMKVVIALLEEEADECDPSEMNNVELEVEADYDFGADDILGATEGDLVLEGSVNAGEAGEGEFVLEGTFAINGSELILNLKGEVIQDEIEEQTLIFTR